MKLLSVRNPISLLTLTTSLLIQLPFISRQIHHPISNNLGMFGHHRYRVKPTGEANTTSYRIFLENEKGQLISPLHDIPLYHDKHAGILNMFVEIPKYTNAKLEIATGEFMNPIKQDVKKGALRFVHDIAPHTGYPWNYGAFPQTWENPTVKDPHTGSLGDRDPIDVVDISSHSVSTIGQVKTVKVLGCLALLDEGETDWKIITIDTEDPLASKLNDISDVDVHFPGMLEETRRWFKIYKVPDGKPENQFAFDGQYKNKAFAMQVIHETQEQWSSLIRGNTPSKGEGYTIDCSSRTVKDSPYIIKDDDPRLNHH